MRRRANSDFFAFERRAKTFDDRRKSYLCVGNDKSRLCTIRLRGSDLLENRLRNDRRWRWRFKERFQAVRIGNKSYIVLAGVGCNFCVSDFNFGIAAKGCLLYTSDAADE